MDAGGVKAQTDDLRHFASIFKALPESEPPLASITILPGCDPRSLSAGLPLAHNSSQDEAVNFAKAKDAGIMAAGNVLSQYAIDATELDREGAAGMRKALRPAPNPPAN